MATKFTYEQLQAAYEWQLSWRLPPLPSQQDLQGTMMIAATSATA